MSFYPKNPSLMLWLEEDSSLFEIESFKNLLHIYGLYNTYFQKCETINKHDKNYIHIYIMYIHTY